MVHKDHVGAVMDVSYSPTGKEFVRGAQLPVERGRRRVWADATLLTVRN